MGSVITFPAFLFSRGENTLKNSYTLTAKFKRESKQVVPIVTYGDAVELKFQIILDPATDLEGVTNCRVAFKDVFMGDIVKIDASFDSEENIVTCIVNPFEVGNGLQLVKVFFYSDPQTRVSTRPIKILVTN